MAAESRRADPSLEQILFHEAFRFDFFQAVRVLERLYPGRSPVGQDAIPSQEVVRFQSLVSLSFPASAIYDLSRVENDPGPSRMVVTFMGLMGLMGVLPRHYTELLLERVRYKDFALRDFLDLFNHRIISLFYRAWEKYRFPLAYERSRISNGNEYDPFSLGVFHLVGMGTGGLRGRLRSGDEALLYYSGLLSQQPRSATALEAMLGDYFGVTVRVKQFIGAWLKIPKENQTRLGGDYGNNDLGNTAMLGSKCWDQQAGFRLLIGPLSFKQFRVLLPDGTGFASLVELTGFFTGMTLDFDAQLVLKAAEVPRCRLGRPGPEGLRLGWSSWLKTKPFEQDASEAVLGRHLTVLNKAA
ncbi:MAG TPA: type VI secretion system baseplate subunit TssG [Candidatus Binatia bacterium]|nr:type VI secretion system baseplate subunit TssG [Candidatus Binatia bacterium]